MLVTVTARSFFFVMVAAGNLNLQDVVSWRGGAANGRASRRSCVVRVWGRDKRREARDKAVFEQQPGTKPPTLEHSRKLRAGSARRSVSALCREAAVYTVFAFDEQYK